MFYQPTSTLKPFYHLQSNEDAESEDEDDEEWDNEDSQESDSSSTNNREIDLSQLLAPAEDYLDDEDEMDPDSKNDPLYSLDIKQYLINFLREFSASPYISHFTPHLNPGEQETMKAVLVQS